MKSSMPTLKRDERSKGLSKNKRRSLQVKQNSTLLQLFSILSQQRMGKARG